MTTDVSGESAESTTTADSGKTPLEALMWDIYLHVREQGAPVFEAGIDPVQAEALRELAASTGARRIAEIGFNVGFSALAFLESAPDTTVVSFELNQRRAVQLAKSFIDRRYPGRHELVIGDSRETLPPYTDNHPHAFDLVFVDGGHTHDIATSDIHHACRLARPHTLVIVDDTIPWFPWGAGPYAAWTEATTTGLLEPLELRLDGRRVTELTGPGDRAWAVGRTRG